MSKPVELKYIGVRKISKSSSSHLITLPLKIVKKLNLKPGDRVFVYLTNDGRIVLSPEHRVELWELLEGEEE